MHQPPEQSPSWLHPHNTLGSSAPVLVKQEPQDTPCTQKGRQQTPAVQTMPSRDPRLRHAGLASSHQQQLPLHQAVLDRAGVSQAMPVIKLEPGYEPIPASSAHLPVPSPLKRATPASHRGTPAQEAAISPTAAGTACTPHQPGADLQAGQLSHSPQPQQAGVTLIQPEGLGTLSRRLLESLSKHRSADQQQQCQARATGRTEPCTSSPDTAQLLQPAPGIMRGSRQDESAAAGQPHESLSQGFEAASTEQPGQHGQLVRKPAAGLASPLDHTWLRLLLDERRLLAELCQYRHAQQDLPVCVQCPML